MSVQDEDPLLELFYTCIQHGSLEKDWLYPELTSQYVNANPDCYASPLHTALIAGIPLVHDNDRAVSNLSWLIRNGADIIACKEGTGELTPLMLMLKYGCSSDTTLFLMRNYTLRQLNMMNVHGNTACDMALARCDSRMKPIIREMLLRGAKINVHAGHYKWAMTLHRQVQTRRKHAQAAAVAFLSLMPRLTIDYAPMRNLLPLMAREVAVAWRWTGVNFTKTKKRRCSSSKKRK